MAGWEVEYTDEFERWWNDLEEAHQDAVAVAIRLLEERGVALGFPWSSATLRSRHSRMRELRVQARGRAIRVLYVFDPRRTAMTGGMITRCRQPIGSTTST
jgi:hypothetical protein